MKPYAVAVLGAVALATVACAGSTRSGKAASGAPGGPAAAAEPTTPQTGAAGATAPAGVASREIEGRIEDIDRANNVTIAGSEQVGHAFERFKVDDSTEITVNGEERTVADINEGDEVRASFSGSGEALHVEKLEVRSPRE